MPDGLQRQNVEGFLTQLSNPRFSGTRVVQIAGGEIPIQIDRRESRNLIVTFTGAVDRQAQPLPQFGGARLTNQVDASIVRFADPTLTCFSELSTAWYFGHHGFETQKILPDLIRRIAESCHATRVIFVGSSAGGAAALYYSWNHPGSIVLVMNPRTNFLRFVNHYIETYRACCWPHIPDVPSLSAVVTTDLVGLYGAGFENTVIYLQNSFDHRYFHDQMAPFIAAVGVDDQCRMLARVAYWGQPGHAMVPRHIWMPWLIAAAEAPTSDATTIQDFRGEYSRAAGQESAERERLVELDRRLAASLAQSAHGEVNGSDDLRPEVSR